MNFDEIARMYIHAYKDKDEFINVNKQDGNRKTLIKNLKKEKSKQYKQIENMIDNDPCWIDNIVNRYEIENRRRREKNEEELPPLKPISKEENKKRTKIYNKAHKIVLDNIYNYFAKTIIMDSFDYKYLYRNNASTLLALSKDEDEMARISDKFAHINEGNNREEMRKFVMDGIDRAKDVLKQAIQIKNDDQLVDFMSKNFGMYQLLSELQNDNLAKFNDEFNLGIPQDFLDDYIENYSALGVDIISQKTKFLNMSNPLYPDLAEEDAGLLFYSNFKHIDKGVIEEFDNRKIDNPYFNPIDAMQRNASMSGTIPFLKKANMKWEIAEMQRDHIKSSTMFVLGQSKLDKNLDNYKYMDKDGKYVEKEDAIKRVAFGETFSMMKNGDFIMKLEIEKESPTGFIQTGKDPVKFSFKKLFNQSKNKDKKLFDDLNTAKESLKNENDPKKRSKIEKNINKLESKIKDAKKDNLSKVDKSFKSSIKDVYKNVKAENPWYIRNKKGDKTFTNVQNILERLSNDKYTNREERKNDVERALAEAQNYLTARMLNPDRKNNEHAKARETAMIQVLDSLRPVLKDYDDVTKDLKDYDKPFEKVNSKETLDLGNQLEVDLGKEEVKEENLIIGKSNFKSNVVDNEELIEQNEIKINEF